MLVHNVRHARFALGHDSKLPLGFWRENLGLVHFTLVVASLRFEVGYLDVGF